MGCVYLLTSPSGKSYVGMTSKSFSDRFKQHKRKSKNPSTYIHKAINKYGANNFIRRILFTSEDVDFLKLLEQEFIQKLSTLAPDGYNLTLGGDGVSGYIPNEEVREKVSKASKETWKKSAYRENQIKSAKDRWKSEEFREFHKKSTEKLRKSPEYKKKLSDRTKKMWQDGVYKESTAKKAITLRGKNSKLSELEVATIKRLFLDGYRIVDLSKEFNLPTSTLCNIKNNKRWGWVIPLGVDE